MIVLVVGLRRSGTSLTARLLHSMGVVMGETWHQAPRQWNPGGYYEDEEFIRLQEKILAHTLFDRHGMLVSGYDPVALTRWRELIAKRCQKYPRWGLKNFGLPFLLMEFLAASPDKDIRVVACRRAFNKCLLSWRRMEESPQLTFAQMMEKSAASLFNLGQSLDVWQKKGGKALEIDYEAMLKNPRREIEALADFCSLDVAEDLESIVDAGLKHF